MTTLTLEGTTIQPENHEQWLRERLSGIGGSEAASAIGINPYETPLSLYLRKTGALPPVEMNAAMWWGSRLEPILADAYQEETGSELVAEQQFVRSTVHPFLFATLDRVRADGRIVELKTVGARSARDWGEPGSDEVPHHYLVQVIHQMVVTGTQIADVAVLIGGQDFRVYTIERDDRIATRIIEAETAFWGCVESGVPQAINLERDSAATLHALFPDAAGAIELDEDTCRAIQLWDVLKAEIRNWEEKRDQLKLQVLAALGNSASARLTDGRILTRKIISQPEKTMTRKAYSYADLRLKTPKGE